MKENQNHKTASRRKFLQNTAGSSLALLGFSHLQAAAPLPANHRISLEKEPDDYAPIKADHLIRSIPENMVYGYYGADVPPVARIKNGETAEIQTVNLTGISRRDCPGPVNSWTKM
ncbi:MAG: hypothetical protein INR73_25885 [Williamsia sp.]|nr:hypothetical protein [Williamsia sp.]